MKRLLGILMTVLVSSGTLSLVAAWADEYRELKGDLRHSTPRWYQTFTSSGHPVGCGATAFAIVFGYWKQHKGKSNLLPGVSMPHEQSGQDDPVLAVAMSQLAQTLDTTYGVWQGKKYGRTTGNKMEKADIYVKGMGYNCTLERIVGTEYDKFQKVKAWLDQDRPVIVLTNESDAAFTSLHYPVIEKARLRQKKVFGRWQDRDVYYSVNMGDGGPNKEIWVREYGLNDHPHSGSFSMYLVNIY
jgi:hypothetical protein